MAVSVCHPYRVANRSGTRWREDRLDWLLEFIQPYFAQWGYAIVFAGTLLENSVFLGAVVPGDVVLLLAGFYAERGVLGLWRVMALAFVGAILGDSIGYTIGRVFGRRLVERFGRRLFLPAHRLARVDRYFQEYGMWAVAIGRFPPAIRTVSTFVAGMSRMPFPRFLGAMAVTSALWSVVVPSLGFAFGGSLHIVRRSLGGVGIVILFLFAAAVFFTYRRMLQRLEAEGPPRRARRGTGGTV